MVSEREPARRLWLVLGGLFLVPLVVGALVLLLVVPDARNDQVATNVDVAAVTVHAELTDECRNVGLAARVGALESVVSDPERAVGNLVSRGDVDYAAVLDDSGAAVATAGALPAGSPQPAQLRQCSSQRPTGAGAVVAERVSINDPAHPGRVVVVAKRLDRELLDEVRSRSGTSGDVVLLDGKDVVVSSLGASTTRALVSNTEGRTGRVQLDGWVARVDPPGRDTPWTVVVAAQDPDTGSRTGLFLLILLDGSRGRRRPRDPGGPRPQPAVHGHRRRGRAGRPRRPRHGHRPGHRRRGRPARQRLQPR